MLNPYGFFSMVATQWMKRRRGVAFDATALYIYVLLCYLLRLLPSRTDPA